MVVGDFEKRMWFTRFLSYSCLLFLVKSETADVRHQAFHSHISHLTFETQTFVSKKIWLLTKIS